MILNVLALWKQEARDPSRNTNSGPKFVDSWRVFARTGKAKRFLAAVGLGTAGFSMQDILLEPYGAEVLHLAVAATSTLTALFAGGTLAGFAVAANRLGRGGDPLRLAALGVLAGIVAFTAVIFAAPLDSALLFRSATMLIGFGGGLFAVGTLISAMALQDHGLNGLALGAWGAVQATAAGVSIALGGALRDVVSALSKSGHLGPVLTDPATAYSVVYQIEVVLLFLALIAIGPLVRTSHRATRSAPQRFGLAELPN